MTETTGKKYMISAMKRQFLDRLPVTVLIGPYASKMAGYSVREILTDAKKSAESHLAFYERFQPDSLVVYNDIHLEMEAVGGSLEFPEDNISRPKGAFLEDKTFLSKLIIPDPERDGRLPYFFEILDRVSETVAKTGTVGSGNSGPWNIAMQLRGAEQLIYDTMTESEFVHSLMEITTEAVKKIGEALIKIGRTPSLGEASASLSLISPKIYREFIKPYHTELCRHFQSLKSAMSLHICGFIDPIMEDVLETGVNFISLDAPSSLEKLVTLSERRVGIMGNVGTTLFAMGEKSEIEKGVDDCLAAIGDGRGYIMASGCEIPLNSTEDRIDHYFNYARQAGAKFVSQLKENQPELF